MIGQVVTEAGYLLTLTEAREWKSVQAPLLARRLNLVHAGTFTEWNGQPGAWQLQDAAKLTNGRVAKRPDA
jgi:hypothetical protein